MVNPARRNPKGSMRGKRLWNSKMANVENQAISIITLYRPTYGPVPETYQRRDITKVRYSHTASAIAAPAMTIQRGNLFCLDMSMAPARNSSMPSDRHSMNGTFGRARRV